MAETAKLTEGEEMQTVNIESQAQQPAAAPVIQHYYLRDMRTMVYSREFVKELAAECIATFVFVTFGISSVASAVVTNGLQGLFQVAYNWGVGLTLAIYMAGTVSGAHLNPAISFAMALFRPAVFPWKKFPFYVAAQLLGGILAGAVNLGLFSGLLSNFELQNSITRGQPGSERSAMILCAYFPNPGMYPPLETDPNLMSSFHAFMIETCGTMILALVVFSLTDRCNKMLNIKDMAPFFIGACLTSLICVLAPLTQASFNPARDLGPRIIAAMAGWGTIAFPGPNGGFWVYLLAPFVGSPIGAAIHQWVFKKHCNTVEEH